MVYKRHALGAQCTDVPFLIPFATTLILPLTQYILLLANLANMKFSTAAAAGVVGAGLVAAAPALEARQGANIDPTVLQFALTLEHLENKFYSDALAKFSEGDFKAAGYPAEYYEDLKYIASDESSHVALLSSAIAAAGYTPVKPCVYSFPYTDVSVCLDVLTSCTDKQQQVIHHPLQRH